MAKGQPAPSPPAPSPEQLDALAKLADVIANRRRRESFRKDPQRSLGSAYPHIPRSLLTAYMRMSDAELDIIAKNCARLKRAGFATQVRSGGMLCYH
jgi:hypothetical protein